MNMVNPGRFILCDWTRLVRHWCGAVGLLLPDQEEDLARAIRAAFDLDWPD